MILISLAGCAYPGSGRMSISGNSVVYTYDERTNLCFAAVALTKPFNTEIEQFSMTAIPCNEHIVALAGKPSSPYLVTHAMFSGSSPYQY